MTIRKSPYHGHRFPPEVIGHAVWLYTRFCLSFRDVEDLLAERSIEVSYETIRRWCLEFSPRYRRALKRREGRQHYLWRAVDQDGEVLDILVQRRRDARAAERFLRKVLAGQGEGPRRMITDKLRSYSPAARAVLTDGGVHDTSVNANNQAELSHQPTRSRERQMRRFKSEHHAQRFLSLSSSSAEPVSVRPPPTEGSEPPRVPSESV